MPDHMLPNPLQLPGDLLTKCFLVPQHPPLSAVPAGVEVRAAAQDQRRVDAILQVQPGRPPAVHAIEHRHEDFPVQRQRSRQNVEAGAWPPDVFGA